MSVCDRVITEMTLKSPLVPVQCSGKYAAFLYGTFLYSFPLQSYRTETRPKRSVCSRNKEMRYVSLWTYIGELLFRTFEMQDALGHSYTIPDSNWSDIYLSFFPVLSAITTFHLWRFCLIMLYYHNFKCQIHLDAVRMGIRYRVTGAL